MAITADGTIGMFVDYANGVNAGFSADPFIRVTLPYAGVTAIAEPGSLTVIGLAVVVLGLSRMRNSA